MRAKAKRCGRQNCCIREGPGSELRALLPPAGARGLRTGHFPDHSLQKQTGPGRGLQGSSFFQRPSSEKQRENAAETHLVQKNWFGSLQKHRSGFATASSGIVEHVIMLVIEPETLEGIENDMAVPNSK